jgi:hypothetical protein
VIEQRQFSDREAAHLAFNQLYDIAKKRPGRHMLRLVELDPEWRQQLRGAFHGDVLREIAEKAWVPQPDGTRARYTKACWKELFRDWFLPDGFTSTEDLDDLEFAEFVLQACAFAAIELGVEFSAIDRQQEGA